MGEYDITQDPERAAALVYTAKLVENLSTAYTETLATYSSTNASKSDIKASGSTAIASLHKLSRSLLKIEAIRIFLAFASYMGFIVYQMDVKSAFLYGKIDEEVYVTQPPGFLDPKYPQKVYKVVKALYGLHQAPRAWYATLSAFLLKNGYRR
ncbi:putative ribonuclease H-like domain-containing protein [Tanacetum coccineum]